MLLFSSLSKEHKQNLLTGGILLIFGIWMFVQTFLFTNVGRGGDPGPGLLPRIVSILVILLSVLLLLTTVFGVLKAGKSDKTEGETQKIAIDKKSIVLTFALFVFYMFTVGQLGYVLSSIIYLFFQITILTDKPSRKQLVIFAAIAAVVPLLVNHVFVNIFNLMLPRGILW